MAKNVTKPVHVHVSKNTKTPAQKAKAEQNKILAAERLEQLQAKQSLASMARRLGFTGLSDDIVVAKYRAHLAEVARANLSVEAAAKVQAILAAAGTYRKRIEGFLAGRINREPIFVLEKINDFMSRPRNKDVKEYVDHVMDFHNKPAAVEVAA